MMITKTFVTKQLKEECMYHKQLVESLKKDLDYQQLTTNMLNQILHQTSELSSEYLIWKTNEKYGGANASKYKVITAFYLDQSKAKHEKV